jgi:ABC-type antimicrobial peptide transport system permease subunit
MLSIFAGLALLLATTGIYGVMTYSVNQRKHEIGVRMALGARHGSVHSLILKPGMKLLLIGIVIGLAGSFALTRVLRTYLYGINHTDIITFAITTILQVVAGLAACLLPARKATKVDPLNKLRSE